MYVAANVGVRVDGSTGPLGLPEFTTVASRLRWKSMTGVGSRSRANSRRETHARACETIAC
jgi:hypothetical protein